MCEPCRQHPDDACERTLKHLEDLFGDPDDEPGPAVSGAFLEPDNSEPLTPLWAQVLVIAILAAFVAAVLVMTARG